MKNQENNKFDDVQYRIDNEGIDYCFEFYSNFNDIEDERFHELRLRFIQVMGELRDYVNERCSEEDDDEDEDLPELPGLPRTIIYDYTSASKADK